MRSKLFQKKQFKKELDNGKTFFRSFSRGNSTKFNHLIIPLLVDDKPNTIIIHVGKNGILYSTHHKNILSKYHQHWFNHDKV